MELYILDRIEDGIAAVETPDKIMMYINADKLPPNSRTGDCFTLESGEFIKSETATKERKSEISSLINSIITKI